MIPITRPFLGKEEAQAVEETILSGWVTQGPKVKQFEEEFASFVGARYACAVSSCTAALHLALLSAGVKPGDRVVTVSHSFIATANSIRHCRAEPIFIDIDPDTYNMAPDALETFLKNSQDQTEGEKFHKSRIAAVMPVHQMGMPCDLGKILNIARRYLLPVIEDAACAVGSEISFDEGRNWDKIGRPHGIAACFSFHPRKVITTGDGGMLTTNDPEMDRNFRLLRHQGMSISDTERHSSKSVLIEEYPVLGYNYRMTDIQASLGIKQLEKLPNVLEKRRSAAKLYRRYLSCVNWLRLPVEPRYARSNWQSFPVRLLDQAPLSRNELMQYLLDNGVSSRPGIMNAHQEKIYSGSFHDLPDSETARDKVILLPLFQDLTEEEIKKITDLISGL